MLNVTPPARAAEDKLTVNVAIVVPLLPSVTVTSFMDSDGVGVGVGVPPQVFIADEVFRGAGAAVAKFAELLSVSVHPPAALKMALVLLGAGAGAPSK
jgi:hypothetical protein